MPIGPAGPPLDWPGLVTLSSELLLAVIAAVIGGFTFMGKFVLDTVADLRNQRDAAYTRTDRIADALEQLLPMKVP
jgi:hypothetical protein